MRLYLVRARNCDTRIHRARVCATYAALVFLYSHHGATRGERIYYVSIFARTQRTEQSKRHSVPPSLNCQPSPSGTRDHPVGRPYGGASVQKSTLQLVTRRRTNVRTPHAPTTLLGCGGVPCGGPLPAAPTPHFAHTCRGQGGGWTPRAGGRGFEGRPSFSCPRNPGNGREMTTAQAAPV